MLALRVRRLATDAWYPPRTAYSKRCRFVSYSILMLTFDDDGGMPTYRPRGSFGTIEEAREAGRRELSARRTALSPFGYQILDADGEVVDASGPEPGRE